MATKVTGVQQTVFIPEILDDKQLGVINKLIEQLFDSRDIEPQQALLEAVDEYKISIRKFDDLTRRFKEAQSQLQELKSKVEELQRALKSSSTKTGFEQQASALEEKITVIKPKPIDPFRLNSLEWFESIEALHLESEYGPPELTALITVLSNNDNKLQALQSICDVYADVLNTSNAEESSLRLSLIQNGVIGDQPGAAKRLKGNNDF